jgi:hypothetical protein
MSNSSSTVNRLRLDTGRVGSLVSMAPSCAHRPKKGLSQSSRALLPQFIDTRLKTPSIEKGFDAPTRSW